MRAARLMDSTVAHAKEFCLLELPASPNELPASRRSVRRADRRVEVEVEVDGRAYVPRQGAGGGE